MTSTTEVGQVVQYFDSMGKGPFAAMVLLTPDSWDESKARHDQRQPEPGEVTLQIVRPSGRSYVRSYIPQEGTAQHLHAAEAIPEGAEVCGVQKAAPYWRPIG